MRAPLRACGGSSSSALSAAGMLFLKSSSTAIASGTTEGQSNSVRLHWFSLTFCDPRTEREYVKYTTAGLPSYFVKTNIVVLVMVSAVMCLSGFWEWDSSAKNGGDYPNSFVDNLCVLIAIIVFSLCNLFFFQCCPQHILDWFDSVVLEAYGVVHGLIYVLAIVLATPHYMGRLKGYPIVRDVSDTDMLLLLSWCTLAVHLNPHIRWHMLIPLQACCILGYALPAFVLRGPDSPYRSLFFLLDLTGLVACASQGKRMIQVQAKQNFLHLIAERTRRVSTEFELSKMKTARSAPIGKALDQRSNPESLPTTTASGRVFHLGLAGADGEQLEAVRELGMKEQWIVEATEVTWIPEQILGVGGFGIVVKGQYQGVEVAIKVTKAPPSAARSAVDLRELCNELQILRRVRHPNIVCFYGALLDVQCNDLALIMGLVEGANLRAFVQGLPSGAERAEVLTQTSCALCYLHTRRPRIIHGDLKDTNIFVESHDTGCVAKLLDFGLSRSVTKNARPLGGSILWVAPEVVTKQVTPDTSSDVFSFGHVAYFALTGSTPGAGKSRTRLLLDLQSGVLPTLVWSGDSSSRLFQSLVEACSQGDPILRPDMLQVHASILRIMEAHYGAPPTPRRAPGRELSEDLQAVRRAADGWTAGRQLTPLQGKFIFEAGPEDGAAAAASKAPPPRGSEGRGGREIIQM